MPWWSVLQELRPVTLSRPNLPHRVLERIKQGGGAMYSTQRGSSLKGGVYMWCTSVENLLLAWESRVFYLYSALLNFPGNACTLRNSNSSRFGKYIQLQLNRYSLFQIVPMLVNNLSCALPIYWRGGRYPSRVVFEPGGWVQAALTWKIIFFLLCLLYWRLFEYCLLYIFYDGTVFYALSAQSALGGGGKGRV